MNHELSTPFPKSNFEILTENVCLVLLYEVYIFFTVWKQVHIEHYFTPDLFLNQRNETKNSEIPLIKFYF